MARKTILLVEDDAVSRKLVSLALAGDEFEVVTAEDGQSALDFMEKSQPSLVILDVMLPGALHGFDLLKAIKSNQRFKAVKVIMLTAYDYDDLCDLAGDYGAEKYLTKPYSPALLAQVIQELLD